MHQEFSWVVRENQKWPPQKRPDAPYGVTTLHTLKSCSLKACFEASSGNYTRRKSFPARIGLAYHRTMQYISENIRSMQSPEKAAELAISYFEQELDRERAGKASNPRECRLLEDENRVEMAVLAIIAEAQNAVETSGATELRDVNFPAQNREWSPVRVDHSKSGLVEPEVPVASQDELIIGRIDRAEHSVNGVRLIDFKLGLSDDVPEQYQRQLQLYAYLWQQSRGEWPFEASLIYSLTGKEHSVQITPEICLAVARDYRKVIARIEKETRFEKLAKPGEVCKFCEFRPWCKPFWSWQASETDDKTMLERAFWGFEGKVNSIILLNGYWKVELQWHDLVVSLTVHEERFPQLHHAQSGSLLRLLEIRLHGNPFRPNGQVRESSEIFIVEE